jgi:hypothetical protein
MPRLLPHVRASLPAELRDADTATILEFLEERAIGSDQDDDQ